ncbi:MAG: FAD-dependent oxidoreductase [Clostridia bacterium]|nr:FAD-dependent oxidoreductase [Clostridia bacterium]
MRYENLFKSIKVGKLKIKNRIVLTGLATALSNYDGSVSDDIVEYFKVRARGGAGLLYTEFCRIDKDGLGSMNQLGAYNLQLAGGLRKIAEGVHRFDAKIFLQLHHAGSMSKAMYTGIQPVAPSVIAMPGTPAPRELTVPEIQEIIEKFILGAKAAMYANFDGVEVHCAHGYLLNQFVSPYLNQRTDEYGGSLENRLRIVKEIMEGIRKLAGPSFPISVRISADDLLGEKGMQIEEAKKMAVLLESYGANIISVSAGNGLAPQGVIAPAFFDQGWLIPLAEGVKSVVKIPVIGVSLIRDFDYADSLVADGKCDMVSLARPQLADPNLVNKLRAGKPEQVRPCIVCMHCANSLTRGRIECAVNPTVGYEREYKEYRKNGAGRKVAVVGGGPAGCEAARVLAIRGFDVTLFEKTNKLGGQLNIAKLPPHKFRIENLVKYYEYNLERVGVKVRLNTDATLDILKETDPYAVVLATGGKDFIPPFIKIDHSLACTANDILLEKVKLNRGDKAVIVGSGMTGMETAHFLLEQGVDATVVEMLPEIGMAAPGANMLYIKRFLSAYDNYQAIPGLKVLSVENNVVKLEKVNTGDHLEMNADCTIFASGVKSVNELEDAVKENFENAFVIGDAYNIGQISHAVRAGFTTAWHLDDGFNVFVE